MKYTVTTVIPSLLSYIYNIQWSCRSCISWNLKHFKQNDCFYVTALGPSRRMVHACASCPIWRPTRPLPHLSDKWLGPSSLALLFLCCLWCHQIIAPFRTRKGPLSAHGMEEYPWWQSLLFHTANNCLLYPVRGKRFWVEIQHIWGQWREGDGETQTGIERVKLWHGWRDKR